MRFSLTATKWYRTIATMAAMPRPFDNRSRVVSEIIASASCDHISFLSTMYSGLVNLLTVTLIEERYSRPCSLVLRYKGGLTKVDAPDER